MSVRRRNVRERMEHRTKLLMQAEGFTLCLTQIQDAVAAARQRGEATVTDRFLREAFEYRHRSDCECDPCCDARNLAEARSLGYEGSSAFRV